MRTCYWRSRTEHTPMPDPIPAGAAPLCGHVVGPVWKDGGESWACELPAGHDFAEGHEARCSTDGPGRVWWVHEVCRTEGA